MAEAGLSAVVQRYESFGPLLGAFLANLLATFGDKGQLVVLALATRYDAKRVFAGAVGAFATWSALEVVFGAWVTRVLPSDVMAVITGGLFLGFGLLTLREGVDRLRFVTLPWPLGTRRTDTDGGTELLPPRVQGFVTGHGPVVASFAAIAVAEFGDKTQFLTIALAAHFPDSRLLVFVGVVAALALRTGVDAYIGDRLEHRVPTGAIEVSAALVFVSFGLAAFGVVGETGLLVGVLAGVALGVALGLYARR